MSGLREAILNLCIKLKICTPKPKEHKEKTLAEIAKETAISKQKTIIDDLIRTTINYLSDEIHNQASKGSTSIEFNVNDMQSKNITPIINHFKKQGFKVIIKRNYDMYDGYYQLFQLVSITIKWM